MCYYPTQKTENSARPPTNVSTETQSSWLTAEMIYFVHAANYRGIALSRGSFMTWLRKVRALQLYSAIQKNKVDTHARKWEEIEEELALQI